MKLYIHAFWGAIVLVVCLGAAHMYRYAPIGGKDSLAAAAVWDRWNHKLCIGSTSTKKSIVCTYDEFKIQIEESQR